MTVDHFEPKAGEEIVMESCPFFTTTLMEIEGTTSLKLAERDSFSVVISTRGNAVLTAPDGSKTILNQGETVLVPASMESVDITASGDSCEIVTTYI